MCKYEHAKFIIERFDHYYDGVNNKGAFYIGLNTFIFGGICVGYLSLHDKVTADALFWTLFSVLVISNILSTFFTITALMPFLKGNHQGLELPSLVYFGGIARHGLSHFKERFEKADGATMLDDLLQQAYCLAQGLDSKYKKLKYAAMCVVAQFITMLPLLFLIIRNLKP
ncbi:hypothetical protein SAMN05444008_1208 [Cnuella takakiae]|uniref:Pycsar effector protein domain-containing protein n=1 Tax=Cnuella takakiae TaxID=1302690 RepID=A0A1M5HPX9_9BACT|nr:Pycsar system effector family protein [Cnuella takakiae]OLY95709.1 hypothetical protein BUE76_00370 [Cnuella takakiae]SHG17990.1 hypothetical protein SAMN05444008_1208 [Cnuella takakiae]